MHHQSGTIFFFIKQLRIGNLINLLYSNEKKKQKLTGKTNKQTNKSKLNTKKNRITNKKNCSKN